MRDQPKLLEQKLRMWQYNAWVTLAPYNLFLLHRSSGKTTFIAFVAAFYLYYSDLPIKIAVVCPTRKKAYDLVWDVLVDLLESLSTSHIKFNKSDLTITNSHSGAKLVLLACSSENPGMPRGHRINVLLGDEIDEFDPKVWKEGFLPTMQGLSPQTKHIRIMLLSGTPSGGESLLTSTYADFIEKAPKFRTIPGFTNLGFELDEPPTIPPEVIELAEQSEFRVVHLSYKDTGLLTEAELAADRIMMRPSEFAREYMTDLDSQGDTTLFAFSDIRMTTSHNPAHQQRNLIPDPEGHINYPTTDPLDYEPVVGSLDIAHSIDGTVLYLKQGSMPLYLGYIKVPMKEEKFGEQISKLDNILNRYGCRKLAVDAGGMGLPFIEMLHEKLETYDIEVYSIQGQKSLTSTDSPLYAWHEQYHNTRSCLFGLFANAVRNHHPIPNVPELHKQMAAHRIKFNPDDKRTHVIPKDEIRKTLTGSSPDLADTVSMSYLFDGLKSREEYVATFEDFTTGRVEGKPPLSNRQLVEKGLREGWLDDGETTQEDYDKFIDDLMNGTGTDGGNDEY